ncbi:MAG: hypothetical protein GXY55_16435 [Phycisphaerae bacterium]|nr:hypothetical protein [Phycisphaerae bacterium]
MIAGLCCALAFLAAGVALLAPAWFAHLRPRPGAATSPALRTGILVLLAAFGLATVYWPWQVGAFYNKHWTGSFPGSIKGQATWDLSGYHGVLLLLVIIAAAAMLRRRFQPYRPGVALSALGGLFAAAACAGTFLLTLPDGGDEGVLLWLFLAPSMAIAVLILLIASLILLIYGIRQRRRLAISPRAICRSCGYDLQGNVSGRCPECGTEIPPEPQAAASPWRFSNQPATVTPPVASPPETTWPAILAKCCGVFSLLMIAAGLMRMGPFLGFVIMSVLPFPSAMQTSLSLKVEPAVVSVLVAVLLLVGTYGLANRQRWAPAVCVLWAVVHLALGAADLAFLSETLDGHFRMWPVGAWKAVWGFAWPGFLLVWFSRPAIRCQVASWRWTSIPSGDSGQGVSSQP